MSDCKVPCNCNKNGKCEVEQYERCGKYKAYEQGREDAEIENNEILKAIRFTLENYSIRLGDYAKVIGTKLKEQK